MIIIESKREGFRRCGIAHSLTPTEHPNSRFTKKQLATLMAEPMLVVTCVEDKAPKDEKNGKGA